MQKQQLFIDAAYESLNHYGEELCGDKVEFIRGEGFFLAVLADGLGSGVKANILATLTSKIIATMLAQGASIHEAVETIASTLPVCSERGIAYSTFTIVNIRDDGRVYIAEFDNPSMVYCRGGRLEPIARSELDVSGKRVYVSKFYAEQDDMLILFSDGVVHAGVGRLLDLGWQYDNIVKYIRENLKPGIAPRELVRRLLSAVNTLYMDKPGDDSTVCAMLLRPKKIATVMVGPPMSREQDTSVVNKLMYSQGLRVVCGGTTSQIVSRVTGKELKVSIDYENPAIPPTASLSGVDLVTEGVLTIGKCIDILRGLNDTGPDHWDQVALNKQDGATQLTKILLESSTEVHFLVGRAINPAHQNPGMPVSLGLKLNLIKELSEELKKTGKSVSIEYY